MAVEIDPRLADNRAEGGESRREKRPMPDLRWKQRFDNYRKALGTLTSAVELSRSRDLSDLEAQGLIQSFEFTHELAWNVLKDYLEEKGFVGLIGSKDATRTAFRNGLIEDGDAWMQMIEDRNKTTHTYDEAVARSVVENVIDRHFPAFEALARRLAARSGEE
jgi:nucleotidyltransferase substrate binding protein (TIGR01987 family)